MELASNTARHTAPFGAALLDVTTLRAFSGVAFFESGIPSLTPEQRSTGRNERAGTRLCADIHRRAAMLRGISDLQTVESHHLRHINRTYPVRLVPNPHRRFGCGGGLLVHASMGLVSSIQDGYCTRTRKPTSNEPWTDPSRDSDLPTTSLTQEEDCVQGCGVRAGKAGGRVVAR